MPHYQDGSEAKIGDIVRGPGYNGGIVIGPVTAIQADAATCNMSLMNPLSIHEGRLGERVVVPTFGLMSCVNCKDFVKLFGLALAVLAEGSSAIAQEPAAPPRLSEGTVIVGPPPDQAAAAGHGQEPCPTCSPAKEFPRVAPAKSVARRPLASKLRAVFNFVRRPFGRCQ
jgi:hypothetical protein